MTELHFVFQPSEFYPENTHQKKLKLGTRQTRSTTWFLVPQDPFKGTTKSWIIGCVAIPFWGLNRFPCKTWEPGRAEPIRLALALGEYGNPVSEPSEPGFQTHRNFQMLFL